MKSRTAADDVNMGHRLFGHCDIDTLIILSTSYSVTNFPTHVSAAMIRKHFPFNCPDCPHGSPQRQKAFYSPPCEPFIIGSELELDFKGEWTSSDGRPFSKFQN